MNNLQRRKTGRSFAIVLAFLWMAMAGTAMAAAESGKFRAGAASVPVVLGADCFPNAEFVGKHDDVYVRAAIFESNRRFAILSADMPSMGTQEMAYCRQVLQEVAGVAPEDSWVTVTHSFSAPHSMAVDEQGVILPKPMQENPANLEAARRINRAYKAAYREAVQQAFSAMREARVGFGTGACAINVNRNMHTVDGWWQGVNFDGFADKTLSVLRVDDLAGEPIAVLYNYSIQSSSASGSLTSGADKLMSSDLTGAASAYVEKAYGGKCAAIFLCGATGDQVPLFKINYYETDRYGKLREGSLGETGYVLTEQLGRLLGNAVVETAEKIEGEDAAPKIQTASREYTCQGQKRDSDMSNLRPALSYSFMPDKEQKLPLYTMIIGDVALVGLLPEMDGITVAQIREASPYEKTMVVGFVNGHGKSMPRKEAYALLQYGAMNSPFAAGSAELTRDVAVEFLKEMKAANR